MKKTYTCHKIAGGRVSGEILFSKDPICFYLIDPKTGIVIEKEHCLYGQSITGKILVFPYGKASSVVQADGMYQLKLSGMGPAGDEPCGRPPSNHQHSHHHTDDDQQHLLALGGCCCGSIG